jgi:quercetin dioxygenase-like cupin family protein
MGKALERPTPPEDNITPTIHLEVIMTANTPNAQTPMSGSELFIHNKDSARAYWWLGTLWIVLADSSDTGGRFSLMEEVAPKGSGPGPHKHTWSDETYYIMDGEITFLVGDEIKTARTGDYVMVPRNTRHAFRVESDTVRFLNGYTPASLEAYVVEWAMPAPERVVPPEGVSPTMEHLATNPELLSRYGMDLLPGPDPLRSENE